MDLNQWRPLRERQDVIYFTGFSLATKWAQYRRLIGKGQTL